MKQGYYPPQPQPQPAQQQAYHTQPTQQNYQQAYQPQPQYRTQPRQKAKQRDNQPAQPSSNQRFRTQVTPKTKIVYNKRLIMIVSAVMVVIALGAGTVFAIKGNNKPAVQRNAQTSSSIVQKFVNAGLPVVNVINYTEETDENNLLGRPNSYTSKTSFADSRLEQFGSDPKGGTVEVFNNKADATSRNEFVSAFSGSVFGMYTFQSDNVLLRISLELTPAQAEEYKTVMLSK